MGLLGKIGRVIGRAVKPAAKFVGRQIPGVATGLAVAEAIGMDPFGGGSKPSGLPTPPLLPAQAGALPMPGGGPPVQRMAMVTPTPMQGDMYQPTANAVRCARGYVLVDNYPPGTGAKVCMRREIAMANRLWRPARKPPISVRDWRALGRAEKTIGKLQKIEQKAKKIANWKSPSRRRAVPATYQIIESGPGSVKTSTKRIGR